MSFCIRDCADTIDDVNVNAHADQAPTMAPPTNTDDQILPHIRWVPIGKSNYYLDVEKSQSNPVYKIAFWDTVRYDKTAGCYKCHLDEKWFDLTKDTLRDALQITPVNNNKAFSSPPSSDALINFVNELGYPKLVRNLSNVITNDMFQPWRALTTIINLCLTRKTSGFERPRAPVLQILWSEYLAKVAKHQRYLAGEQGSDPDSPAPKPTKATKKSKPSIPKADLRPPVTKPASSQQPEPKPALTNSLRSIDESVAEGIPEKEPRVDDEEADVQRALEERLKSIYDTSRGSLSPVVIREPESGKYQLLSEVESDEDVLGIDAGVQGEGHARQNPDDQDKGQAGPNPGDAVASQPLPSHVVHAGPNLEHMDLEVTDVSTQPHPEQIDEGFTATAYPKVQENLKHTIEEQTTAETEAESMVFVTIQQDTSSIPPMTTPVIDLTSRPESPNVHQPLKAIATETTTTTTIHPPPSQTQQSTRDSMLMKHISELEHIMANLIQDKKHLEERLDSHGARLYTLENLDIPQ
uniref:Monodehydroascorbate reductase n=1 Tax=Tanacetum cinerariifolium TaxID=118510 RepID=A0A699HQI3_TANCI|nr:hypothetical protein [Tanacetum cinerariifolium]